MEPIPGYILRRFLGRGGFGEVWEADSPRSGRIALKFMVVGESMAVSREVRAMQMISQLGHPNLIRIDQTWCIANCLAVAMELAEGSLADLYEASHETGIAIKPTELCGYLNQAAKALDFLNARQHIVNGQRIGIQHCDIKPSNLLLCGETIKLCDFGLASITTSQLREHRKGGTRLFMAPEVYQGRLSDRTDQYSLAVTYCLLRGGRVPFAAVTEQGEPQGGLDLSMLPSDEQPIVARGLAPLPENRWPSCGRLMAELARLHSIDSGVPRTEESSLATTESPPETDAEESGPQS
jgi:serine/threonine protein kinase